MEKLKRGDKIYLDKYNTKKSRVNEYLDCRDGLVEVYEYTDSSGYGDATRLFLCRNTKHEVVSIIRQVWDSYFKGWHEEEMVFDSDSFKFLEALINGEFELNGVDGKYTLVRDYSKE